MLCDSCLNNFVIPRLREDDIAVLQYLYNNNINLSQIAQHKHLISDSLGISYFRGAMALFRLEAYDLVKLQPWSKAYNYYLTIEGEKVLTRLSERMGGE